MSIADIDVGELDEFALDDVMDIRADARTRNRKTTINDQLYRLYLIGILLAPFGYLLAGALETTPRAPAGELASLADRIALVGPLILLALGLSGLRLAVWTGPVVVSRADIAWLFSLPVPRSRLVRPRLRRALLVASVVGLLVGTFATIPYHVTVGLTDDAVGDVGRLALAAGASLGMYAVVLAALGWLVEVRRSLARALMRGSGVVLVVLVVAIVGAILVPDPPEALGVVALASGPWGWAVAGILAGTSPASIPPVLGLLAQVALGGMAAVLVVAVLRRAGAVPLEELSRRAATSAQVTAAAVYFADFRSAAQARDRVVRALIGRSRRGVGIPRRPAMLFPWIGATVLMRQPRRVGQAMLWVAGGTLLMTRGVRAIGDAARGDSALLVVLVPLSAAVAYGAAGTLIEPLRVEIEQRFGLRMLRQRLAVVGLLHLLTPVALLWLLGVVLAALLALAGLVPPGVAAVAPVAWLLAAPALVIVAGVVASGPPADSGWLYTGESGLGRLALHLARGPLLSALVVGPPILLAGDSVDQLAALPATLGVGLVWVTPIAYSFARWIQRRLASNH